MKRTRVLLVLSLLCLLSSIPVVMATPTLSQTGSESPAAFTVEGDSDDSYILVEDWLYSFLDNVFGLDRHRHGPRYYSAGSGWDYDHGDGDWGHDHSGGHWGDGDWGYDHGSGSLDNDDMDITPLLATPSPGALVLGAIGLSFVSWLRRSRTL